MLPLSHLSPSTISPKNMRALLLHVKDKLPVSVQLLADPESNILYFQHFNMYVILRWTHNMN